jgi:phage terminase small subunit
LHDRGDVVDHGGVPTKKRPLPPKNQRRPAPSVKTPDGLSPKQQRFVAEYLIDQNATQAAIRAGYSPRTAKSIGYENLTKPDVLAAITGGLRKLMDQPVSEAERIIAEAKRIAFSDIRRLYDPRGRLLSGQDLPDDIAPAVSSMRVVERSKGKGETEVIREVKLWDKNAAIGTLARVHKLLTEKVEVNSTVETRPDPKTLSDAELDAALTRERIKKLEAEGYTVTRTKEGA